MSTYRVVTVAKTVYVHNVKRVYVDDLDFTQKEEPFRQLVFQRDGSPDTRFPLANVVSYEVTQ